MAESTADHVLLGRLPDAIQKLCVLRAFAVNFMTDIESTARKVVHAAVRVHKTLGPGLLENVYQKCLAYELGKAGLKTRCEVSIPVWYDGIKIDTGFRADMIVEDELIIENKTVDKLAPIHEAQLLTYMKLSNLQLGFLLNWNATLMKEGIKRMIISSKKSDSAKT